MDKTKDNLKLSDDEIMEVEGTIDKMNSPYAGYGMPKKAILKFARAILKAQKLKSVKQRKHRGVCYCGCGANSSN